MSYDSLYFTSSPSAAILDPMGWTRTSYMPGRLEDPASRLTALSGVTPSRLTPSVDAAGGWGLDTAGPDLSALYKGHAVADADPDAPPEPDPELLGLVDRTEEENDWALAYLSAKELAAVGDVGDPPADTSQTQSGPIIIVPKSLIVVAGLKPGAYCFMRDRSTPDATFERAQVDTYGRATFWIPADKFEFKLELNFAAYAVNAVARITSSPGGLTFGNELRLDGTLFGAAGTPPLGTTVVGNTITIPTARLAQDAQTAHNWAAGKLHLNNLRAALLLGNFPALKALKFYYSTWYYGRSSIPELGNIVANGSTYARSTFFAAISRLAAALQFNSIIGIIKAEANWTYRTPKNLFLPSSLTKGVNLTRGTAALAGYLSSHPEVTGHSPIAIKKSDGRIQTYNADYSLYIRTRLVELGNTLNSSAHKGNLKKQIQDSVRAAAKFGSLHFFFDGKNDPWDGRNARGRELQQRRTPALPFLDPQQPFIERIAHNIAAAQANDIATVTARVYDEYLDEHGPGRTVAATAGIRNEARQRVANGALADAIIDLLVTPGVIYDSPYLRIQDNLQDVLTYTVFYEERDVNVGPPLRQALRNYINDPLSQRQGLVHALEVLDFAVNIHHVEHGGFAEAPLNDAMRIINTLMIGTDHLYEGQLTEDPYRRLITTAHGNVDQIIAYRPLGTPPGLTPIDLIQMLLTLIFVAPRIGSRPGP